MDGERFLKKIIIAAMDEEDAIGKNGEIPWHYPEDMRHFKKKTKGNSVIMGRKTYFSLPEDFRPLPDRENIVLTKSDPEIEKSVKIVKSLEEAFDQASEQKVFIAGGASVYRQTLDIADEMILTRVPGRHDGDTFFPEWNGEAWKLSESEKSGDLLFKRFTRKN